MGDWQPIETAPKDGTRVLVSDGRFTDIVKWSEDADLGRCENGPGWQICSCEDCWYSYVFDEPTHWMPLPPAPEVDDEK